MSEAVINLTPKQTEAWNAWESEDITDVGFGGAAGGGKSRLGIYLAITIAEMYPGSRGAIGRKQLKTLRITTLAEFFIVCAELGYTASDYVFDGQDNIIRFPNGSEILLLDTASSPQDPEYTRFGSLNLTWAWVEESNESPDKGIAILKTRVGRHNSFTIGGERVTAKAFWLETFNPNKGHVYRTYYKPFKEGTLPHYRVFIPSLPGDNPHLPEAYIENLRRSDKVTRERLLNGNFEYDADPTKIISYEAITDLQTNTILAQKGRYLINDIARFGGDKIVLGEFHGLSLIGLNVYTYQDIDTTKDRIKDRAERSRIPYSCILSDEDGIGGGVVDGLTGSKGFLGGSRPTDVFDSFTGKAVSSAFVNLRSQCYFKLAEMVNTHLMNIKLQYFETNVEGYTQEKAIADLLEELDHIKRQDQSGQQTKQAIIPKSEIKESLGRSPDFADVMMMRMYFELKPENFEYRPRRIRVNKERTNVAL
jgi:phage terminase large subunit